MRAFLLLFILVSASCSPSNGTNTGNPGATNPPSNPASGTVSGKLVSDLCVQIASCYTGADSTACENQITALSGFTAPLGSPANTYSTMSDLAQAEVSQTVSVNQQNFTDCQTAISQLSCSSSLIVQSYSQSNPSAYNSANVLFQASPSCAQIY
jgi:hypothetical protein